jgi:hypothetical protein
MANNFADDSRIIDFWRFENNLIAGKNGNDLTASAGGVGYLADFPRAGEVGLDLERSSAQFAKRLDADLSAGFPLKNGDTVKKGSFAFWFKPESVTFGYGHHLIHKSAYENGKYSLYVLLWNSGVDITLRIVWGYGAGTSIEEWTVAAVTVGTDYHCGIAFDGAAKTCLVRLWDGAVAATYTYDYANELNVGDGAFRIGTSPSEQSTRCYDGLKGELVVANDLFSADEFDQIRQGIFPLTIDILPTGISSEAAFGTPVLTHLPKLVHSSRAAYSPNKSNFFLANRDWYGMKLKVELGWNKGGGAYTEFVPLFLGKITKWGPISRAVDADGAAQPNTCEIYAKDWIMDCLQKRIALPAADGTPNPRTFGEFLCVADPISGWSPAPVLRSAAFEQNDYSELDLTFASGGGAFSLVTPGLTGDRAFRAAVTGANQKAYGSIKLPYSGEMFVTGAMRFTAMPGDVVKRNFQFLRLMDSAGDSVFSVSVQDSGMMEGHIKDSSYATSNFMVASYLGVPVSFAMWLSPLVHGRARLWINGDEVMSYDGDISDHKPREFRFGAEIAAVAESWTVEFDDIEVKNLYYYDAYQVTGGPFESIGAVYLDKAAQNDVQLIDSGTLEDHYQTLIRYPQYGMVQFTSDWRKYKPSGEVMCRVVEYAGGRHALDIIQSLLAAAGLTEYIDPASIDAAAYAAVPLDIINARFEGGGDRAKFGLKDVASTGVPIADALREITSRCLYWIFVDAGVIKVVPYTGIPPASPVRALDNSNLREVTQSIDLESINEFVSAVYGWYDRNPTLFVLAGTQEAGGLGTSLDYTWDSPVACERRDMVEAKVNLLLKFLSAQEMLEPVRMNLAGARLELMDTVSVSDPLLNDTPGNYAITRKEVSLTPGAFETSLQLRRILGEN